MENISENIRKIKDKNYNCLEKHVKGADVIFVQMPLPIYEKELTSQERNMHTAYWNKLTELIPNMFFSPDRPIFNFMEVGLGLPILSGEIKAAGYNIGLIDLMKFSGPNPDYYQIREVLVDAGESKVFLLSPMTCGYEIFQKLVQAIKEVYPQSTVVAGGPHVSKLPKETLLDTPGLDIATTDQRFTTKDLVQTIISKNNLDAVEGIAYRLNRNIVTTQPINITKKNEKNKKNRTIIDLDILPSRYADSSWARIYTTLGCAYNCAFCADILYKNKKPIVYDIDDVLSQVDSLRKRFGISLFYIGDETFTYDREHAKTFAKCMGKRTGIYWIAQTRADCVDPETMGILAENNCILLNIGAETGSKDILRLMRKGITPNQVYKATKIAKNAGLNVFTYWMTGLPGETYETIQQSMDMQRQLFEEGNCDLAEDVIFVPYPGTEIYYKPEKFNVKIEQKPWAEWREDMNSVTNTQALSSTQIYEAWLKKIYKLGELIKSS